MNKQIIKRIIFLVSKIKTAETDILRESWIHYLAGFLEGLEEGYENK